MESLKKIPTRDGTATIYTVFNTHPGNTKAILYVHGLGGGIADVAATIMASQLPQRGYDVIRFGLYSWRDGARCLTNCTLATHAQDVDTVASHVAPNYDKIYACGHSYGAPSLMLSRLRNFAAISLWDPTYIPKETVADSTFLRVLGDAYAYIGSGTEIVLSHDFVEESRLFDEKRAIELSKACTTPMQVIHAGEGYWLRQHGAKSYHSNAAGLTDYHVIQGSVHCFDEEGTTQPLIDYTKTWFDGF